MKRSTQQLYVVLIIAFMMTSCQKEIDFFTPDPLQNPGLENHFFEIGFIEKINTSIIPASEIKPRTSTEIDQAYNALIEENKSTNFVPFLIREYGFPIWGYAEYHISESEDQHRVFIPLTFENANEISGYLLCDYSTRSYTFRLVPKYYLESIKQNYCQQAIGNKFLLLYGQILEELVYGTSEILPLEVFAGCSLNKFTQDQDQIQIRNSTYEICITFCVEWTNEIVTSPNIGGILCNLIFGLTHSCPNTGPANTTNISEQEVCTNYEERCFEVTTFEIEDIPDHDGSGNWWGNPNHGSKPKGGQNH